MCCDSHGQFLVDLLGVGYIGPKIAVINGSPSMGAIILSLVFLVSLTSAGCPNGCNSHGRCDQYNVCHCFGDWYGHDCGERTLSFLPATRDVLIRLRSMPERKSMGGHHSFGRGPYIDGVFRPRDLRSHAGQMYMSNGV